MLEKITLRNFQCHESLKIEFDPFITVICGVSDSGKSSLLRAIRWVCLNRPSGDASLRHGEDMVSVYLHLDGYKINRQRGKVGNLYRLDKQSFRAFGNAVPEAIIRLVNVGPVNFSGQHDSPFWFSLSPGEVSRELNQIVALDLIDKTLGNLASELRTAKTTVEVSRNRLQEARQRRDELEWVKEADKKLRVIEELDKQIQEKQSRITLIALLIENVSEAEQGLADASTLVLDASACISLGEQAVALDRRIRCLKELIGNISTVQKDIAEARGKATVSEKLMKETLQGTCPVCNRPLPT